MTKQITKNELLARAKSLRLIRLSRLNKMQLQALVAQASNKLEIPVRHMPPGAIFKLLLGLPAWEWRTDYLQALPAKFLEALCTIMGCAKSGTKAKRLERLTRIASVRLALSAFPLEPGKDEREIANALAQSRSGKALKSLCKQASCTAPSTKYGMAASLLNWRKECARKGQAAYVAVIAHIKARRAQLAA